MILWSGRCGVTASQRLHYYQELDPKTEGIERRKAASGPGCRFNHHKEGAVCQFSPSLVNFHDRERSI